MDEIRSIYYQLRSIAQSFDELISSLPESDNRLRLILILEQLAINIEFIVAFMTNYNRRQTMVPTAVLIRKKLIDREDY